MTIDDVQRLAVGVGERVVPDLDSYDAGRSEHWVEAEYRAALPATDALVGAWEGEPGWVAFDEWPYHEVCVVLSGRVAIEDETGARAEFGAGEAFVVPAGFRGTWHTVESTRKIFVGITPQGASA